LKVYELHTKMEIVCRRLGTVDAPSCIFIYTEEEKTADLFTKHIIMFKILDKNFR